MAMARMSRSGGKLAAVILCRAADICRHHNGPTRVTPCKSYAPVGEENEAQRLQEKQTSDRAGQESAWHSLRLGPRFNHGMMFKLNEISVNAERLDKKNTGRMLPGRHTVRKTGADKGEIKRRSRGPLPSLVFVYGS